MAQQPGITQCLEAALRGVGHRQAIIANNIANLQTPGFRRSTLEFEKALAEAIERGRGDELEKVKAEVVQPRSTPVDASGNDVDLEEEMGQMFKNVAAYKTYLRLLARTYRQMELAIRGE